MLNIASTVTGYVSISGFVSLICVLVGITSSTVKMKIYAFTAGIKKFKSITKRKKKKHHEIVLLGKYRLNAIEVLTSKSLIDSYISYDEFISVCNALGEYNRICKNNGKVLRQLQKNVRKTKQNRLMLLWNCTTCDKKKQSFFKNQELDNFDNISNN